MKIKFIPIIILSTLLSGCAFFNRGSSSSNSKVPNGSNVSVDLRTITVRNDTATITDSGRENQKCDIVKLDYDYDGLVKLGYIYLDVNITLEAKEVDDGYQYIFLYNNSSTKSNYDGALPDFVPKNGETAPLGLLASSKFEIGAGKKQTSWEERKFHFVFSTGNMIDSLYIRYGASGNYEDNWNNRNVSLTIQPVANKA